MNVCICAGSALEFWRIWRIGGMAALRTLGLHPLAAFGRDWRSCRVAGELPRLEAPSAAWLARLDTEDAASLALPVDLMVSEGVPRGYSLAKITHAVPTALPSDAVVQLAEGVYVTSPECALAHVAHRAMRAEVVRLVNEYCGTYAIDEGSLRGFAQVNALTTCAELEGFCLRARGLPGVAALGRHLPFAVDGCASPAESSMVSLLCLPRRDGGHGLPLPEMNVRLLAEDGPVRHLMDRSHYVGDAVWRRAGLVVEYDSRAEHTRRASVAHDSIRKMALEAAGWHVTSVTPGILADEGLLTKVAHDAARRLGVRVRPTSYGTRWRERNDALRRDLLDVPMRWHRAWALREASD